MRPWPAVLQGDILRHAQIRKEVCFLMDGGNPPPSGRPSVGELNTLITHENFTLIRLQNPAENVDERTLTRAVFAQKRMDGSRTQIEADAFQGRDTRKSL